LKVRGYLALKLICVLLHIPSFFFFSLAGSLEIETKHKNILDQNGHDMMMKIRKRLIKSKENSTMKVDNNLLLS
jgi:hypothetical protein